MITNSNFVKDQFGKLYKIHSDYHGRIPNTINAINFSDPESAKRFLLNLEVSLNFWHQFSSSLISIKSDSNPLRLVSNALYKGKIKIYDVTSIQQAKNSKTNSILKAPNSADSFKIESGLSSLSTNTNTIKQFNNQKEAEKFIKELSPNQEDLQDIIKQVQPPGAPLPPPTSSYDDLIVNLGKAIVSGSAVVSVVSNATTPLQPTEIFGISSLPGNRKADLGPPADNVCTPEQELISVTWSINEAMCGDEVTLNGSAQNFPPSTDATADITNDKSSISTLNTQGQDSFSLPWKVKNAVFSGNSMPDKLELFASLNALGQSVKTPHPLIIKRVPDKPDEAISWDLSSAPYEWTASFRIAIEKNILHVKQTIQVKQAWLGKWLSFDQALDERSDWGFIKKEATTWKFWDTAATPNKWVNLPRTIDNYTVNPIVFIKSGNKYVDRNDADNIWPEAFIVPTNYDTKKQAWLDNIHAVWDNKFILKHKTCGSSDAKCCSWDIRVKVNWSNASGDKTIYIISAQDWERSNAQDWYLSEERLGVAAHECGHLLGAYDEYNGGANDTSTNLIDDNSIMGSNLSIAHSRHLNEMRDQIKSKINVWTGKSWDFEIKAK
ncbi:MAG: hypothetical protein QM500_17260 [Methylococcales bacterium]